jgi:hypothetical protein
VEILSAALVLLGWLLLELFAESVFALAWEMVVDVLFPKRSVPPLSTALVALFLGVGAGLVSIAVLPERLWGVSHPTGASVILAPLAVGMVMERYGRWRSERGSMASPIASFEGGAAFAFGLASVRWWWALSAIV